MFWYVTGIKYNEDMELKKLIGECIDALQEKANEAWDPSWDNNGTVSATVNTDDGYIDLFYAWSKKTRFWECEAVVYHDYEEDEDNPKYGHESVNLEKFLERELSNCVDWDVCSEEYRDAMMDEWESHGFRDEGDFWRWKEGRR